MRNTNRIICILLCTIIIFQLTGCSSANKSTHYSFSGFYFNTVINITLYDLSNVPDPKALESDIKGICLHYESLFSRTVEGSDVDRINKSKGAPVTVSEETIEILERALYYCDITDGAFDITTAPLSILWNVEGEDPKVPDEVLISEALSHVDYHLISISGNAVTLQDPEAKIDLGAIAKGYIADKIRDFLKSKNIDHVLINLGGNVLCMGGKSNSEKINVGIRRPFDETGEAIVSASITDGSIVTSGSYERYFEENGRIYHHIMDPATGYPADSDLLSVTVFSPSSMDGDALSTALFVLGTEKGMELIDSMPDCCAVFVDSNYSVHYSKGCSEIPVKVIDE